VIRLTRGDLLKQDDVDAIVTTVNCVGVMGKGIALRFKNKWPANFAEYASACKSGKVSPGRMFIHDSGGLAKPNHIINFPPKTTGAGHRRSSSSTMALIDLVAQVKRLGILSIAIPPLGCGNGGLYWADVRPLVEVAFAPMPGVEVRLFEPVGAPDPKSMVVRTKRPRMTSGRAAAVKAGMSMRNWRATSIGWGVSSRATSQRMAWSCWRLCTGWLRKSPACALWRRPSRRCTVGTIARRC